VINWSIFNSADPLHPGKGKEKLQILDDVVTYFNNWKHSLGKVFKLKAEQAKYFISWQTMFDLMVRHLQ
jgi:hypothetical protein